MALQELCLATLVLQFYLQKSTRSSPALFGSNIIVKPAVVQRMCILQPFEKRVTRVWLAVKKKNQFSHLDVTFTFGYYLINQLIN